MEKTDISVSKPQKIKRKKKGELPVIGISLGDFNGIGPEVVIKALADKRMLNMMTPVIFGSSKVVSFYRKSLNLEDSFNFMTIRSMDEIAYGKVNVINCWQQVLVEAGKVTNEAGEAAWLSLKEATQALKDDYTDAIVTAPINKHNIQNEEFKFAGHTEYFAQTFEAKDMLMMMVHDQLRVGVATGHIPLNQVSNHLTRDLVRRKLKVMEESLKLDFGILKPKIAVLGLNPHAGEDGLLGSEEQEIIKPVIQELKEEGKLIFGPFPADGFFGVNMHKKFDGILAMYHDQGLVAFKTMAFEQGVNFTAGLPVVRTSPDHGTAYDIAGKGEASEVSMREAFYLACDVIKARQEQMPDE
ncbi:4-hydroxythreonine-4-phosphate dehydrogenase [Catalinimonas alkaloidigena]|uniref:4-hydroxythreonine-4-phosphate dehydrogenase PdxA n=1 Tax=Catalinimonas alkaloidigena TaxID=1075417 RepID=UPI0024049824|nr:4-hydroxythreonine-4-phosphate dehydrogenase PdxA [Catalinimonas alkaloidigena]MDF9799544.1 4-hydroxythreonine-4-phosphate dehydrogenase [Catalinimonas alkaloidigena]